MIQRIIKIICDNCGQGIYDVPGTSVRQALKHAQSRNAVKVVYTNGGRREFCNEQCYQEWKLK